MASEHRRPVELDVDRVLRCRASIVDVALILAVPVALLWVYSLPTETKTAYALSYTAPTASTMYASHFVHVTEPHLRANLVGYGLVVPLTYLLCVLGGRRQLFRVVFVALLVALPFALSALNLLFVRPRIGYGFSGLVMGYFGFLPIALFGYVDSLTDVDAERHLSPALFFLGIVLISASLSSVTAFGVGVAAAGLVICVGYLRGLRGESARRVAADVWDSPPGYVELAVVALLLFVAYPFVAFPAEVFGDGTIVNLYTHLLGYAIGFISTYSLLIGGEFGTG